uniref:Uncharacterized protein n=1 Tax=Anguilla anguilla TaxID=7936 RepID=A0A0E9XAK6_ANGAN
MLPISFFKIEIKNKLSHRTGDLQLLPRYTDDGHVPQMRTMLPASHLHRKEHGVPIYTVGGI